MTAVDTDRDVSFLRALARRIGTRLVVFVPRHRPPRSLWIGETGDASEISALEETGRAILAEQRSRRSEGTREASADVATRPEVIATTAAARPDERDEPVGVLLAAKHAGGRWSDPEYALMQFATDYYAPELAYCAQHPRPTRALDEALASPRARDRLDVGAAIGAAADKGELYLLFQPELDMQTGRVVAVEALARWMHPERGALGPDSFIEHAERSDVIDVLGDWVMDEAFGALAGWQRAVPGLDISVRVNVSPAQARSPGFVAGLADALARHGIRGEQVCIELTENLLLDDDVPIAAVLTEVKGLGVTSAIDDLASGYSSLGRLRSLVVDVVKIDRSLVSGIDSDDRARTIVRYLIELARALGVEVVVEGVETAAEAETLLAMGARRAQGHYYARPMTAEEVVALLCELGSRSGEDR